MSNFKKNALLIVTCLLIASSVAFAMKINGQLEGAIIERLAADPTGTGNIEGRVYYNTVSDVTKVYNGTTWVTLADTAAVVANPMDSAGDLMYGGTGGTVTKLDSATSGQHLVSAGAAAPVWTGLASANFWLGNGSSIPTAVAMSGDVTMSNAGVTTIGTGEVTSAMVLDGELVNADVSASAAIAYSKLNLATSIVNADVSASAAIAGSKIVSASGSVAGVVDTGTQTFAGAKTFTNALTASASIRAADGSVTTPSVGFTSDTNTGMYWVSADVIGFATGGSDAFRILADQSVAVYYRLGLNGDVTPTSFLDLTASQISSAVGYGLRIRDTDTTVDSTNVMIRLEYTADAGTTGATFIGFEDSDGEIGSIKASSGTNVAFNTSSDRRLKKNIRDMHDGIERMRQVRPRYYQWIEDDSNGEGFVAQELVEVVPSAVSGDGKDPDFKHHPMAVDYGKLTPVLAAAVKDLIAQNEEMLVRIAKLEKKLKDK